MYKKVEFLKINLVFLLKNYGNTWGMFLTVMKFLQVCQDLMRKKTRLLTRSMHISQPILRQVWRFLLSLFMEQITYFQVLWSIVYLITKSPLQHAHHVCLSSSEYTIYPFLLRHRVLIFLGCQQIFSGVHLKKTLKTLCYVFHRLISLNFNILFLLSYFLKVHAVDKWENYNRRDYIFNVFFIKMKNANFLSVLIFI